MTGGFDGKPMEQWKYSESPLVDGDKVVCTPPSPDPVITSTPVTFARKKTLYSYDVDATDPDDGIRWLIDLANHTLFSQ
jgi:hypothetical protein